MIFELYYFKLIILSKFAKVINLINGSLKLTKHHS